ncbi:MBOAT family O-acyltransferase [Roseomonas elaeocarpi]|uniref:Probable alginate O-acetylase AlgI n=1 Tax=Roseomonas elaeocarpi TaxID=907779 RepID=A0ABV6JQU9_9PROT
MAFSSIVFLFYFLPLFLLIYLALPPARMWVIIAGSLVFYAWGEPFYIGLLLVFIVMNWWLGLRLERASPPLGRALLTIGVSANILLLAGFKYAGFFMQQVDVLARAAGWPPPQVPAIPLPLGISFFAFQGISYLMDIRRGEVRAQPSLPRFAMYKTMFPQLIAGPILRYRQIAHEINDRRIEPARFRMGIELFVVGLAQKVLIANTVALPADQIFALPPEALTAAVAWLGAVCYMVQIFFDFAGYTTMAIGLGHMLGFSLPPNFNRPYTARSVTDFWRRWHMSLSSWFRDYLYIPLGGNRAGAWRTYANLLIVFALCGLWHGAAWPFVVWGLYHGLFLILERAAGHMPGLSAWGARLPAALRHAYLLLVVLVGWVIFRADTLGHAGQMLAAMTGFGTPGLLAMPVQRYAGPSVWTALAVAVALVAWKRDTNYATAAGITRLPRLGEAVLALRFVAGLVLLTVTAAALASGTHNPFIYFRF